MTTPEAKHPALTPKGKIHEAVYLAWWKQKLNKGQGHESRENIDWNEEISQDLDWHTINIPDTVVIEELRSRRQGTLYEASFEELKSLAKILHHATDATKNNIFMRFSLRALEIAVEEFDIIDNVVAEVVFDQRPKCWEEIFAGYVEEEHKYRYGAN